MNLFNSNKKKLKSSTSEDKKDFLQKLVEENYRNRLWITIITMLTFLVLLLGIGYSMYANTPISKDWKEILLLVLGAFIGSYQKIINFWFEAKDLIRDMVKWADEENSNEEDEESVNEDDDDTSSGKQLLKG